MLELIVGLFALALGWMCLDHVSRVRSRYSEDQPVHSRFYGEKPLMIFPSALGVLFILDGLALLILAVMEWLQITAGDLSRGTINARPIPIHYAGVCALMALKV